MKLLKFSNIPSECLDMDYQQMQNYLLDNGFEGIKNNLTPEPQMEYSIADLEVIWERTKKVLKTILG